MLPCNRPHLAFSSLERNEIGLFVYLALFRHTPHSPGFFHKTPGSYKLVCHLQLSHAWKYIFWNLFIQQHGGEATCLCNGNTGYMTFWSSLYCSGRFDSLIKSWAGTCCDWLRQRGREKGTDGGGCWNIQHRAALHQSVSTLKFGRDFAKFEAICFPHLDLIFACL